VSTYLIELLDHDGDVGVAHWISLDDDADAINRAQAMDVVRIGVGYNVWQDRRLVFRHWRQRRPLCL
jgi:hypothetical protein